MSKILVARTPRTDRSKAKEGADDCEAIVSVNLNLTDYNVLILSTHTYIATRQRKFNRSVMS